MVRIIYPRIELGEGKYSTVCTVCYEEELVVLLFIGVLRPGCPVRTSLPEKLRERQGDVLKGRFSVQWLLGSPRLSVLFRRGSYFWKSHQPWDVLRIYQG